MRDIHLNYLLHVSKLFILRYSHAVRETDRDREEGQREKDIEKQRECKRQRDGHVRLIKRE